MCERIPDCRLRVLENSAHTPQLDEPEAFHAAALPFLLGKA
jgi:pimeloyl-ACP methyl ester carboxylesterase